MPPVPLRTRRDPTLTTRRPPLRCGMLVSTDPLREVLLGDASGSLGTTDTMRCGEEGGEEETGAASGEAPVVCAASEISRREAGSSSASGETGAWRARRRAWPPTRSVNTCTEGGWGNTHARRCLHGADMAATINPARVLHGQTC